MFVNHEEVKIKNKEFFSIIGLIRNCRVICCFRRQNAWQLDWATSTTVGSSRFRYIRPSRKNTIYPNFEECRNTHSFSIFHWFCLWIFPPNLQNRTHKNNLAHLEYIIHNHNMTHLQYKYFRTNRHTKIQYFFLPLVSCFKQYEDPGEHWVSCVVLLKSSGHRFNPRTIVLFVVHSQHLIPFPSSLVAWIPQTPQRTKQDDNKIDFMMMKSANFRFLGQVF